MKLFKTIRQVTLGIALGLTAMSVNAQNLPETQFEDQFEKPLVLNQETKWVLVSSDKASGKVVKEALDALKMDNLAAKGGLYIADISGMPSLISKMFAIPKMKDYAFKIALVSEEDQLKEWPRQEEKVSAIKLNGLEIESVEYFDSVKALQDWIAKQ